MNSVPKSFGSLSLFRRDNVLAQIASWKRELPMIKPYYAVKSNPDLELLRLLKNADAGFDCASAKEIELVKGIGSDSIVFANPCKTVRDIECAKGNDVTTTVVDSVEEVEKLAENGWKGSTLIRIKVEDSGSKCQFSSKFGAELNDVPRIAIACGRWKIPVDGISFHVGSECMNPLQYEWALNDAYKVLRWCGRRSPIIDIGGGFVPETFGEVAKVVRESLVSGPLYIAEPGRFFSSRSQDLLVKVIGKKAGAGGRGWRYTIDESLYGQFSNIAFDHAKPEWTVIESGEEGVGRVGGVRKVGKSDIKAQRRPQPGVIFGRTCDSLDVIEKRDDMPELFVGDWLYFRAMGAYTGVTASEFNGFPKPMIVYDLEPKK